MTLTEKRRGFTLVELLVVVGMIMLLIGAMSVSAKGSMERARVQKATAEVKVVTQAILAYENELKSNGQTVDLPTLDKEDCDANSLGFLLGRGTSTGGSKLPVFLMATLSGGGKLNDPWGHPYKVTIKKKAVSVKFKSMTSGLRTGYFLPNANRLGEGER